MNRKDKEIKDFLSGEMRGDRLANFRNKLKTDEELLTRVSNQAVAIQGRANLKKKLNNIHDDFIKEKKVYRFHWIAAVMILALGVSLIFSLLDKPSGQDLFDTHFTLSHEVPLHEHHEDHPFYQGLFSFSNQNYDAAITHFESHPEKENHIHYYLGLAHLAKEESDAEKALEHFDSVVVTELTQELLWYKSLGYLLLDSIEEAKKQLEELIEGNHIKADKAKELLDQLK